MSAKLGEENANSRSQAYYSDAEPVPHSHRSMFQIIDGSDVCAKGAVYLIGAGCLLLALLRFSAHPALSLVLITDERFIWLARLRIVLQFRL